MCTRDDGARELACRPALVASDNAMTPVPRAPAALASRPCTGGNCIKLASSKSLQGGVTNAAHDPLRAPAAAACQVAPPPAPSRLLHQQTRPGFT